MLVAPQPGLPGSTMMVSVPNTGVLTQNMVSMGSGSFAAYGGQAAYGAPPSPYGTQTLSPYGTLVPGSMQSVPVGPITCGSVQMGYTGVMPMGSNTFRSAYSDCGISEGFATPPKVRSDRDIDIGSAVKTLDESRAFTEAQEYTKTIDTRTFSSFTEDIKP